MKFLNIVHAEIERGAGGMPEVTGRCPMCEAELVVTHLRCRQCGTGLEGVFHLTRFDRLSREQLRFVDVFLKNRGVIRDVERELTISYPTVRSRLDEVIRALGYDTPDTGQEGATTPAGAASAAGAPAAEASAGATGQRRREILDRLFRSELTPEEAISHLRALGEES
jgi:hypothetical protein